MEPIYEITRSQLADAFAKWNKDAKENPKKFTDNSTDGKSEADALLEYLGKK